MSEKELNDRARVRLADIMGNQRLSGLQKSLAMLRELEECENGRKPELMRFVLESYGLAPRHETAYTVEELPAELVKTLREKHGEKISHHIKGFFEINRDRPVEKTMDAIIAFLEDWPDEMERAVVFERILASKHVPIPVNYFSRYTDEPEKDNLLLRAHSLTFIQLRQLINLRIGPTSRGSLIQDFLAPLASEPYVQAVVLGAFVEELIRRLQKYMTEAPAAGAKVMAFPMNSGPADLEDMMKRMREMLPPEVMEQLRKLFNKPDEEENH